jgi:DNA-binding NtrC family response regulator
MDGLSALPRLRQLAPEAAVIVVTAFGTLPTAVQAVSGGACDYLAKPFDLDQALGAIDRALARRPALPPAAPPLASSEDLIGASPAMQQVFKRIALVAPNDACVLITGESGTGKEVVARMIHDWSPRHEKPFVAVNCGALAENLIEAELFGHEKGAFTGAVKKRDGRFKAADGGTLFLDEVAELPAAAQAKLLRVLQGGTFEPLGTNLSLRVDVRILSATHRNLPERIKAGLFREDLYYRINVIEIPLPALRERPGDLPLLLRHFVERFTPTGAVAPTISPAAWATLLQYDFPGNVRELSHAVEHAIVLSGGKEIDIQHLPPGLTGAGRSTQSLTSSSGSDDGATAPVRPLHLALREFEQQYLQRALKAGDGKRNRTAAMLGISRKTLWEKLRTSGIGGADEREPHDEEVS